MSYVVFTYIIILILCCIEYLLHYKFIRFLKPDLTIKQKAYIFSIKSSLTLFLAGIYYNYYYFTSKFDESGFYSILEETNSLNFGKLIVIYFTAYLIMDLIIGLIEYPKEIGLLTGYIHHSVYIIINIISLYLGIYPIYLLNMLSELPTLLISIGIFDSTFRNDTLFGMSFFTTRLFYHGILTYTFRHNYIFFYISLATLGLHGYWFYNWWNKYGKKIITLDRKKKRKIKIKNKISKKKLKNVFNSKIKIKIKKK